MERVDGENSEFSSGVFNQVNTNAIGNSGGVTISTKNLNLTNGGKVSASTSGQGDASAVKITATGDIIADGEKKQMVLPVVVLRVRLIQMQ